LEPEWQQHERPTTFVIAQQYSFSTCQCGFIPARKNLESVSKLLLLIFFLFLGTFT
jgi:hypothetical protein